MNKRRFLLLTTSLALGAMLSNFPAHADDADSFPLRKVYSEIKVIGIDDMTAKMNIFTVIDVRSPLEYSIMHIQGAINIPLSDKKFVDNVKQTVANNGNKMAAFYCNGHRCHHSYEAAKAMTLAKTPDTIVFDGGINDWAEKNPQLTILLDKPFDSKALITEAKFNAHSLAPAEFMRKAREEPNAYIIDIRDKFQRDGVTLFPGRDINTGMEVEKLKNTINAAKSANQTLLIFDDSGARGWPLQYFLEDMGVKNYYFMKGGIVGYGQMLQGK